MIDGERTDAPLNQSEQLEATGARRVARLPGLVESLANAPPDEKPAIAKELNDLLVAMRAPGQEAAEAAVVLAALNAHQLDGPVDTQGRSCRKEAVETLLATGFPHALQVAPEDLEFARGYRVRETPMTEWQRTTQMQRRGGAVIAGLGAAGTVGWQAATLGDSQDAIRWTSIVAALAIGLCATRLAQLPPDTRDQAPYASVMAVGAFAQMMIAAMLGWASVPSLAATTIALFIAFASQYVPDPGNS